MFPPHYFSCSENSTGLHWKFSWKAHEPWTALLKSCISAITSLDRADVTGSRHVFSTSTGLCFPIVTWGDTDMRAQLTLGPPHVFISPIQSSKFCDWRWGFFQPNSSAGELIAHVLWYQAMASFLLHRCPPAPPSMDPATSALQGLGGKARLGGVI